MPRRMTPSSATSRGQEAKDALFGGGKIEAKSAGLKTAPQAGTAGLIGGIDASEDERWQSAAHAQISDDRGKSRAGKRVITPSSGEGIGLEVTSGIQYILRKLKEQLISRGARGIVGLQRKFKIMDDDDSKSLSFEEFRKAVLESGLQLTDAELQMMFNYFDRDASKSISFEEFIGAVRVCLHAWLYIYINCGSSYLSLLHCSP
jgi:hypothetical protein